MRYCALPASAPNSERTSDRAMDGSNSTGALRVPSVLAPSRAMARSPAVRPIASAAASRSTRRALSYQ